MGLFSFGPQACEKSLCPWELSLGGEGAAAWSLGVSAGQQRMGRPVCFPSPSVNGPMENSSGQLTADSVSGLQGPLGRASLLSAAELQAC